MDDELLINEELADEEPAAEESLDVVLGTIKTVTSEGVTIQLDGEEEAGEKLYKVNASALFEANDRVKVHKDSGTMLIEYPIGKPMAKYPIPPGGSDGQFLVKDGANPYKVKWSSSRGIPSGGSAGQVLAKTSNDNYAVAWVSKGLPSGGSAGQVLTKNGGTDYDVAWKTIDTLPSSGTTGHVLTKTATGCTWQAAPTELPSGGSAGQFLEKTASGVQWASVSASALVSGGYSVTLNSTVLQPGSSGSVHLGSTSRYFGNIYTSGTSFIGYGNSSNTVRIGGTRTTLAFFGATNGSAKKTVGSSGSLATLISALQSYGLIA